MNIYNTSACMSLYILRERANGSSNSDLMRHILSFIRSIAPEKPLPPKIYTTLAHMSINITQLHLYLFIYLKRKRDREEIDRRI